MSEKEVEKMSEFDNDTLQEIYDLFEEAMDIIAELTTNETWAKDNKVYMLELLRHVQSYENELRYQSERYL